MMFQFFYKNRSLSLYLQQVCLSMENISNSQSLNQQDQSSMDKQLKKLYLSQQCGNVHQGEKNAQCSIGWNISKIQDQDHGVGNSSLMLHKIIYQLGQNSQICENGKVYIKVDRQVLISAVKQQKRQQSQTNENQQALYQALLKINESLSQRQNTTQSWSEDYENKVDQLFQNLNPEQLKQLGSHLKKMYRRRKKAEQQSKLSNQGTEETSQTSQCAQENSVEFWKYKANQYQKKYRHYKKLSKQQTKIIKNYQEEISKIKGVFNS